MVKAEWMQSMHQVKCYKTFQGLCFICKLNIFGLNVGVAHEGQSATITTKKTIHTQMHCVHYVFS